MKLAIIFLISLCLNVGATNYYVSTSGNDSNNGTSSPWLTIGHAESSASAGDTITVSNGTYNAALSFSTSGSSGNPITLVGVGSPIVANNLLITANYINLSGFEFASSNYDGSIFGAVVVRGAYVNIANCTEPFYGVPTSAAGTGAGNTWAGNQATSLIIQGHNDTFTNFFASGSLDTDFIHVFGYNNTFYQVGISNQVGYDYSANHTDGYQTYSYSGATCSNILFDSCYQLDGSGSTTCGNFENDGNAGITNVTFRNCIWANVENPFSCGVPGTVFQNCIFYACSGNGDNNYNQPLVFYGISNYSSVGSSVQNCVFLKCGETPSSTSEGAIGSDGVTLSSLTISSNYFGGTSYAAKVSSGGNYLGTSYINGGNPSFTSESGYDYHIPTNSILAAVGINLYSQFTNDYYGNQRQPSGAWDIGVDSTYTLGLSVTSSVPAISLLFTMGEPTTNFDSTGTNALSVNQKIGWTNVAKSYQAEQWVNGAGLTNTTDMTNNFMVASNLDEDDFDYGFVVAATSGKVIGSNSPTLWIARPNTHVWQEWEQREDALSPAPSWTNYLFVRSITNPPTGEFRLASTNSTNFFMPMKG